MPASTAGLTAYMALVTRNRKNWKPPPGAYGDPVPATGSLSRQAVEKPPKPRTTTPSDGVDRRGSETKAEAARIQEDNRRRRAENAARRGTSTYTGGR